MICFAEGAGHLVHHSAGELDELVFGFHAAYRQLLVRKAELVDLVPKYGEGQLDGGARAYAGSAREVRDDGRVQVGFQAEFAKRPRDSSRVVRPSGSALGFDRSRVEGFTSARVFRCEASSPVRPTRGDHDAKVDRGREHVAEAIVRVLANEIHSAGSDGNPVRILVEILTKEILRGLFERHLSSFTRACRGREVDSRGTELAILLGRAAGFKPIRILVSGPSSCRPGLASPHFGGTLQEMSEPQVLAAKTWLEAQREQLVDDTRALLRIPSVHSEPAPGAPFGLATRQALDFCMDMGRGLGMKVVDLDGYSGYVEFGEGAAMVGVFGHLDVVPVSDGWKHPPFGAEIDGEYLYARGAVDDKGPTMACFYAARAIRETYGALSARMRIFFGCSEETGDFPCLARYMKTEQSPTFGIAPDSGWPLFHGEKGISNLLVKAPLITGDLELLEISGGSRHNIVIDSATAKARLSDRLAQGLQTRIDEYWDKNLTIQMVGSELHVSARGKAAHGASPFLGDNAITRILRFFAEIAPVEEAEAWMAWLWSTQAGGEGLGIAGGDEPSGALTSNLGVVRTDEGIVSFLHNIRYPVTWEFEKMRARCEDALTKLGFGFHLANATNSNPLYFPLDHPMVRVLSRAYEIETGETREPGVMGGGTYARMVPNTVSVGTGWAGDGPAHENDEKVKVEHLHKMARIYARMLLGLLELTK